MNTKLWNILCWNIRGINSEKKWNAIRDRLSEHVCGVICLQETKRSHFDLSFIHKFCPPIFDRFDYLPAVGAFGGSIIIWKSTSLSGTRVFHNDYATSVQFTSLHNNANWLLTNVYAPCTPTGKRNFIFWFKNIAMPGHVDWLIVGDFNLYRSPEDRNRPGADFSEIFLFNEAISSLGLVELPLKGKRFTWTNKQHPPLLERLD
jgi:exonuclease III